MFANTRAFSGFSVDDMHAARTFYADALGLNVSVVDERNGLLSLSIAGGTTILVYAKENHTPATYTVLNFPVDDVAAAVDELTAKGTEFQRYDCLDQDGKGIHRGWRHIYSDPRKRVHQCVRQDRQSPTTSRG